MAAAAVGIPLWLSTGVVLRGQATGTGSWFVIGDPLVALGCLTALLWRRRFPLAVAMTVAIASTASALASGAAFLALVSLSTRRRPVEAGVVALALVTASQFTGGFYPTPPAPLWLELAFPALIAGIAVAVGTAIGARRVELRSLRERAESAEREQTARAAQARALERNRIAREMHDVLAHRISLVAMQPGCWTTALTSQLRRTVCWSVASPTAPTKPWKNYGMSSACSGPTRAARNHHNPPSTGSPTW